MCNRTAEPVTVYLPCYLAKEWLSLTNRYDLYSLLHLLLRDVEPPSGGSGTKS